MGTLIPFSLIIIALALFLGLWFGRANGGGGEATPPVTKALVIDKDTIDENPSYKVANGSDIYYGPNSSDKITLSHNDLNVKALSEDNGGETNFIVEGEINFGFMVDPSMDFHLMGMNESLVKLSTTQKNACGIIVGTVGTPNAGEYNGNMMIDSSVNFSEETTPNDSTCYGLYFSTTSGSSTIIINGSFSITCWNSGPAGYVFGVYFNSTVSGFINVKGVFHLTAYYTYGVYFNSIIASNLRQIINGLWCIYAWDLCCGVRFYQTSSGSTQTINGIFSIYSQDKSAYGIKIDDEIASQLYIDGFWSITSKTNCYGVQFDANTNASTQTINGTFTIYSNAESLSINLNSTTFTGTSLNTTNSQYFSNKKDSTNIFGRMSLWTGSWKWNGNDINKSNWNTTTNAGDNLSLTTILDSGTSTKNCNFWINVINSAITTNKATFNNGIKKDLGDYMDSKDCPLIAKGWLQQIVSIISQI